MKKIIILYSLFLSFASFGQVGIKTKDPKAMLDIKGTNYNPDGTSNDEGKGTLRVDGNTNHALDFGTLSNSPYGSYIHSRGKISNAGLPLVLNPTGGTVGMGTSNPRGALDINRGTTNTMGLVLPTNSGPQNIVNPMGGNVAIGTTMYDSTLDCVRVFRSSGWSNCVCECNFTLVCSSGAVTGVYTEATQSSGTKIINYTGGSGQSYGAISVASVGVIGLTATAPAGTLVNGNGSVNLSITGVPITSGTASFTINLNGKTCNFTINVTANNNWNSICTSKEYGFNISTNPNSPTTITVQGGKTVKVYAKVTQGSRVAVRDPYTAFSATATQAGITMQRNYYRIGTLGDLGTGAYSNVTLVFDKPINFVSTKATWFRYVNNTSRDSQLISTDTGGKLKMVGIQGTPALRIRTEGQTLLAQAVTGVTDFSGIAFTISAENYFKELTVTYETNFNDILQAFTFCDAQVLD
ncbi:hypothetical protein DRF65_00260 [Chryseobacterium pennae]|uniref:Uncharacterized protein n=1 Tax=Chryseobacterium pennae TaxID=2258962 RepID=A0A3D9CE57_9FLAO|nr:hypothetical protein [Chryseobacterium pennae]REC64048.1 hypothetical protein DRF65_00260 [Chryseobacterium pennae]